MLVCSYGVCLMLPNSGRCPSGRWLHRADATSCRGRQFRGFLGNSARSIRVGRLLLLLPLLAHLECSEEFGDPGKEFRQLRNIGLVHVRVLKEKDDVIFIV